MTANIGVGASPAWPDHFFGDLIKFIADIFKIACVLCMHLLQPDHALQSPSYTPGQGVEHVQHTSIHELKSFHEDHGVQPEEKQ